ncbi:MAG: DUF1801 domain-containing protein [Anaerolineae bacterium]|nr:DUF1801 domain-containing protein [Anaerolineae bacterium]
MNGDVSAYIDKLDQAWKVELCRHIRQIIHEAIPDVVERIQYGKPHFLKNGKYACVLSPSKAWVSLTIFNAQTLEAPDGFFEPSDTTERKTVKLRQGQAVDDALIAGLIGKAANSL